MLSILTDFVLCMYKWYVTIGHITVGKITYFPQEILGYGCEGTLVFRLVRTYSVHIMCSEYVYLVSPTNRYKIGTGRR